MDRAGSSHSARRSLRRPGGRLPPFLVSIVALAAIGGCGSEDAGPSVPFPDQPVGEFHAKADQLCLDAAVEEETLRRDDGIRSGLRDQADQLAELAGVRVEFGDNLAELAAPDQSERNVAALIDFSRGRASASVRVGRLIGADASKRKIAAATKAERDQRVRFVRLARKMDLEECAERLDPDSREEIVDAAIEAFTAESLGSRCDRLSDRLVEQLYGDRDTCLELDDRELPLATSVTLSNVRGIADVYALARVVTDERAGGQAYRMRLTFERGRYRLDELN